MSCSSQNRDEQFCKCMNLSKAYSDLQRNELKDPRSTDKEALDRSLKLKEDACKDYLLMSGDEMLKRKAECKD